MDTRCYVPALYYDQDKDESVHAVLDKETNVWYFGEDSEEGAKALADEMNSMLSTLEEVGS